MQIDTDFDGGNVIIEKIDGDHVYSKPDYRDSTGPWFYWYFAVKHANGRTLTFHPTVPNMLTNHAPAYSVDEGTRWQWLEPTVCPKAMCLQSPSPLMRMITD